MEHILIIENKLEEVQMLTAALEIEYKLSFSGSEEEAITFLQHKIPDLILVENNEPQVSVIKLLQYIKRADELTRVPVIVLTDGEDELLEEKCMKAGASDFIFRPCTKVGICCRVKRVLELEHMKRNLKVEMSRKSAEIDEMRDMAKRDPLTRLWNRVHAEEMINEFLSERRNCGTLLMIDMDNFKEINDSYGHIVGDEILVEFGHTLRALTRQDDIVCRLGGDEFVVFLKDVYSHAVIIEKVEQIIVTLEKRIVVPGADQHVSVSTGIAVSPMDGRTFNQLYQNADKSLYYVKQNRKGSYHFFSEEGMEDNRIALKKNTQVDLEHLRSFIQEVGYKKGAYQVEYDGFKKIYRFIARCIGRTKQEVQTVLFTLHNQEGRLPDVQDLVFSMDNLKNAVHESIRRGDVATNYSSSQFVVILMDSSFEDADMVARRIREKYSQLQHYHPEIGLDYDIQTVSTAPSSNDF